MASRKTTLFYAVLIAVAFTAIGMVLASRLDLSPRSSAQTLTIPVANNTPISGAIDALTFRNIARSQNPTVVNVRTESRQRTQELTDFFGGGDELFRRFFGVPDQGQRRPPREERTVGAGSGFVIDPAGYILTNNHVVEGANRIQIAFFGDDSESYYDAKIVGRDPLTDSALLELVDRPAFKLPVAKFGNSDHIEPGDWVIAIGNPFALSHTVTVGVVSATERPFYVATQRSVPVLQTDAAINPGNSGGPLLNIRGEVVGINTAIVAGERASNLGIGFAIPINTVLEVLPQLKLGKVTRGRIGVEIGPVAAETVQEFGLKERMGAVVRTVDREGPAGRAGIRPGDVIVKFNDKPVKDNDALVQMVTRTKPGTTVPVEVIRNKQPKTLSVTVEELNLEAESGVRQMQENESAGFGVTLEDLTPDLARRLRVPGGSGGAVVADVERNGPAARAGVRPGDVILEINRRSVDDAAEAVRTLQAVAAGRPAFLLLWRNGSEVFVSVTKE
jgi:serine protease Do